MPGSDEHPGRRADEHRARREEFLPLTPAVFHILLSLARGNKHGYGIIVDVRERTSGEVTIGTGTLYTALQRLEDQGLIEEASGDAEAEAEDDRRRYYRLRPLGVEVLRDETARLREMVNMAEGVPAVEADSR